MVANERMHAAGNRSIVALSTRAFAKINLTLRVTGRRPDGYHDVRTVLQSLALHDTLRFRRIRGPFAIACDDPHCPTDRSNLVWQAATRVWRAGGRRGVPRGVLVSIEKRIPLQAGLGGGSSDAAAAIRALNRLWRLNLPADAQRAIAATVGADVPFFLEGGTALGVDRGDALFSMLDVAATWVTLVVPPFGVSTKDAYGWWDQAKRGRAPSSVQPLFAGSHPLSLSTSELRNDLEGPVSARHPEISRIVRAMGRAGASYAAMSGSGSAVFGLFDSRVAAAAAGDALRSPSRRTVVTQTIDRRRHEAMARPQ